RRHTRFSRDWSSDVCSSDLVSIAINILAAGLTTYLLRAIFDVMGAFSDPAIVGFQPVRIPLIADIPVLGRVLSGQSPLVYVALRSEERRVGKGCRASVMPCH